jgi:pyruvate/2-oxoglutarate dehydrogenase complex dihydrolipoamide dehydrogenase (E3) component
MKTTPPTDSAFDQELLANIRPGAWQNPTPRGRYNLVVVGAGTAGLVCAAGAAGLGARVALVEKNRLGGDCLNYGCVPSKALLRCARAVGEVRRAAEFGVGIDGRAEVDFSAVMERMRRLRAQLSRRDSAGRFQDLGVDVYLGEAQFTGRDTVAVEGQTLSFARAVIATGARAAPLDLPGLHEIGFFTNETIFDLTELPRRLVIVGGGPIGCELGQAFRRFGSEVVLIQRSDTLLGKEEPECAAILRKQLARDGVALHLGSRPLRVERKDGQALFWIQGSEGPRPLPADAVLVAVGRRPNVEHLGLEQGGVAYDSRGVQVNDFLQSTNRRIYAAGDVCSAYKFTHAADAMARLVLRNALLFDKLPFGRGRMSRLVIPRCTYTDPEIAQVGLTAREAAEQGVAVQTYRLLLTEVDRAVLDGEEEGFAIVHVRRGSDRLVGATVVAAHAGEIIGEMVLAMTRKLGLSALSETIHPYPTQAEVLRRLGDLSQRSRLTPALASVFRTLLRWSR